MSAVCDAPASKCGVRALSIALNVRAGDAHKLPSALDCAEQPRAMLGEAAGDHVAPLLYDEILCGGSFDVDVHAAALVITSREGACVSDAACFKSTHACRCEDTSLRRRADLVCQAAAGRRGRAWAS